MAQSVSSMHLEGRIEVDSTWDPVIYLSMIDRFDQLNTASYHFLIGTIELDKEGRFNVDIDGLPGSNYLYRLHICKYGDPISTIIIGGREENFIHFIGNANSSLKINEDGRSGFKSLKVHGHNANPSLNTLLSLRRNLNAASGLSTVQNRNRIKNKTIEDYRMIIDTSSFGLIRLLGLHFLNELDPTPTFELHEREFSRISDIDSSPYVAQFKEDYAYLLFQKNKDKWSYNNIFLFFTIGFLGLALIIYFFFRKNRIADVTNIESEPALLSQSFDIQDLSAQERRVWDLLKEKLSNKEIASNLNIEVTTVKSHVYRIYNKLGIKSRKEVWRD